MVGIHDLRGFARSESWVQITENSMVAARRASDLYSLRRSNKVSLLTGEQTPRPHTGNNIVEYKLILVPVMILSIVVYKGYVEITP